MNVPDQSMDNTEAIAYEILEYLIDNPNAQDTLEGIVTWWLLARTIQHQAGLVKQALGMLVEDGFVIAQQGSDTRTHYKINLQQRERIISLLRQRS